jgi:hypothetical protein
MAVPTITSLDPASGLTRGDDMIRIVGTGFRVPPAPPATGYLGGDQPKTVSVKFEGQESLWAYSASDSLILARVPEYRGPHDVTFPLPLDVRVANLDDAGAEIAGENVTLVDGYSVGQPSLAAECYFQRVVRAFQHVLKRHVMADVYVTVSRDAASLPLDDERLKAEAPALYLRGPRTPVNRFDSCNLENEVEGAGDSYTRRRYPVTMDFEFVLTIVARGSRQLYALVQSCILLFRDITEVRVLDDPNDDPVNPTGVYKEYEIEMPWPFAPDIDDEPNDSDLFRMTAGVMIRGVHIDDEAGTIIERGWKVTSNDGEPTLDVQVIAPSGL